ncbi:MAG: alcohol dehydrogenase catalytic domain-containing protein [Bacteroidales bacterium]|nr:alcohol dehydrogenase catalytic domain-containing protein [Bacteroidales bacterium]
MKAITFQNIREIECIDVPDPEILEPGDLIVKTTCTAICGSDMHVYHGRETGIDKGTVMGHEFTGEVVETGTGVTVFKKGDHVVSPFTTSCGKCYFCKTGLTARCERSQLFGWVENGKGLQGAQAEYVRIPLADSTAVLIPENVQPRHALLAGDILSTGYFCAEMAEVQKGKPYVVVGCGPVGLLAVLSAFDQGADRVYAIDPVEYRLKIAEKMGAVPIKLDDVIQEKVQDITQGIGFESVMEAVGSPGAQRLAYQIVRQGGIISTVGVHTAADFSFSPVDAYNKNITYKIGRCSARHYMDKVIPRLHGWSKMLDLIITHTMSLDEGKNAYRIFDQKLEDCIKILLNP